MALCGYGMPRGRGRSRCEGVRSRVQSVAFSPDGAQIASGDYDGTVRLWDAAAGEGTAARVHERWVLSVAFSPDGAQIASGGVMALCGCGTPPPVSPGRASG